MARRAQFLKLFGEQEAIALQRAKQRLNYFAGHQLAHTRAQVSLQIERRLLAVKKRQPGGQQRRDDQNLIRILERIAEEQPRPFRHGGRENVQTRTQTRKYFRHSAGHLSSRLQGPPAPVLNRLLTKQFRPKLRTSRGNQASQLGINGYAGEFEIETA
jgi:hypothetical protein